MNFLENIVPICLVIDVKQKEELSLPTEGYFAIESTTKTGEII